MSRLLLFQETKRTITTKVYLPVESAHKTCAKGSGWARPKTTLFKAGVSVLCASRDPRLVLISYKTVALPLKRNARHVRASQQGLATAIWACLRPALTPKRGQTPRSYLDLHPTPFSCFYPDETETGAATSSKTLRMQPKRGTPVEIRFNKVATGS